MTDDEQATQRAALRRHAARVPARHFDAKSVELAAFSAVGRREVGLRLWDDANKAAQATRRSNRNTLRTRYGARNPNGWLSLVAFGGALSAPVGAVLTSGLRQDPEDTALATAILTALAGVASLLVLTVAAGRPLNRLMIRLHGVMTIALVVAAALTLSRDMSATAVVASASAIVSVVGYAAIFVCRARDVAGTQEIDSALNVAFADTVPEAKAAARRLLSEVEKELGPEDSRRIRQLRTTTLADFAPKGVSIEPMSEDAPAGSAIVNDLIARWAPEELRGTF